MTIETKNVVLGVVAGAAAVVSGAAAASAADAGAVDDWSGLYVGGSVGYISGDTPAGNDADGSYDVTSGVIGLFGGYNHQFDNFVIGGEINWFGPYTAQNGDDIAYTVTSTMDARLRLGVDMGGVLFYGFGGITVANLNSQYYSRDYALFGSNFGLGAEMKVLEDLSIGLEGAMRNVQQYDNSGWDYTEGETYSVTLRASYHF